MRNMKKLFTLVLSLLLSLSMAAAALAADEMRYTDVTDQNWYHGAVAFVTENQLMDGLTETTFGPGEELTRQALAAALYRLAGSPEVTAENPFTDTTDDAAVWACSTGLIPAGETAFQPDSAVQRQVIATMLARYLNADTTDGDSLEQFSDAGSVQDGAKGALSWAAANELLQGNPDGTIDPKGNATRAQAAAILQRFAPMAEGKAPAAAPDTAVPADGRNEPLSQGEAEDLQARASAYIEKKQFKEAADCYRKMEAGGDITESELADKLLRTAYAASQAKDYTASTALLQEAAGLGSASAINELGVHYLEGLGVEKDAKKAFSLFQEAAKMDLPAASYNVGVCYAYGYGVEQNDETAFSWFLKSAEAGAPSGMFAAGAWYAVGTGTGIDKDKAVSWLEKYLDSGNTMWKDNAAGLLASLKADDAGKTEKTDVTISKENAA